MKLIPEKERDLTYQPTILPSCAAFDIISLFEAILDQQLSHFHGVTIKTAFHIKVKTCETRKILLPISDHTQSNVQVCYESLKLLFILTCQVYKQLCSPDQRRFL